MALAAPAEVAPITEDMLDKVDNKESDDFTDFDNKEDALGIIDEQRALLASFE
jgi:hypothetical protein